MAIEKRSTSKAELEEVIKYWHDCPRCSNHLNEDTLIRFLNVFTPHQIKGAMYVATSTGHWNYFRYLCGILHNWRRELELGKQPAYFDIGQEQ